MIDLNKTAHIAHEASARINELIDAAISRQRAEEPGREYLGASSIGHDCLRKIQWDWTSPTVPAAKSLRIFTRGHWAEDYIASFMVRAGFTLLRKGPETEYIQAGGRFRGHCDGVILSGPELPRGGYPCLWEHKCLGAKWWRQVELHGIAKAYPAYADQVALYQAYLDLTEHPAIFTVLNADTMELLHVLVPFDPERAQRASDRAVTVLKAQEAGETLPRVASEPDDFRCKMCGHKEKCWP